MTIITEERMCVALSELAMAIEQASETAEYEQDTGDSNRLLRCAASLTAIVAARGPADHDAGVHLTYDIAAMLKAALRVPCEPPSAARRSYLQKAATLITEITGDPEAMDMQNPRRPSDPDLDAVADAMPGGMKGFLKIWGLRQYGRAVLEKFAGQEEACHVH